MANIPEWQYPLYKEPDKVAYAILEKLGKNNVREIGIKKALHR